MEVRFSTPSQSDSYISLSVWDRRLDDSCITEKQTVENNTSCWLYSYEINVQFGNSHIQYVYIFSQQVITKNRGVTVSGKIMSIMSITVATGNKNVSFKIRYRNWNLARMVCKLKKLHNWTLFGCRLQQKQVCLLKLYIWVVHPSFKREGFL